MDASDNQSRAKKRPSGELRCGTQQRFGARGAPVSGLQLYETLPRSVPRPRCLGNGAPGYLDQEVVRWVREEVPYISNHTQDAKPKFPQVTRLESKRQS
ncbi:hypothetical protein CB1_000688054 [Camelus ferus]|nr:hypothetical protein CB1_000688054 [Camelus ferus]